MSSFNLLNIGIQSLQSNSTALNVVGQNIANVNTEGYSRQRAEFSSIEDLGGVQVRDIARIADEFLNRQIWSDTASYSSAQTFESYANELDNLLASDVTSISTAMDEYFGALATVVDDPISLPNRELFLAEADALVRRFNDLNASLERQSQSLNDRLASATEQINALARNIATINDKLRIASAAGSVTNELLDQRDAALEQLSGFINFTTVEQSDTGEIDVFVGNGQPLIVGGDANRLVMTQDPADVSKMQVSLQIGSTINEISDEISGGQVGGLLAYRDTILDRARDELGVIAISFAAEMNEQHAKGMDLNGDLGGPLFGDLLDNAGQVLANANNSSSVQGTVTITDTQVLEASEYKMVFSDSSNFTLIRQSDGASWSGTVAADGTTSFNTTSGVVNEIDGFELSFSAGATFAAKDQFVIRPARTAASDLSLVLNDARQLALASPVKVEASVDNQGTAVASVTVTDSGADSFALNPGQLTPPTEILFVDSGGGLEYQVLDSDTSAVIASGSFTPGEAIELDGYSVTIANRPVAGDRFVVEYNTGGVSDNRNALALSDLQFARTNDGASFQDNYGQLIERVGTQTQVAQINAQASKAVLDANIQNRAGISGVNLDEEAAKLIQFQQAYQASSQLIRASQTIFDALLAAV
ncbi:MAG: flagellar hook-associated protein FlgK [Oceanospirillaceae bacterium]|nr:flagellar hook-associated protein FlgK [Oceanospirillaceae bacterium]